MCRELQKKVQNRKSSFLKYNKFQEFKFKCMTYKALSALNSEDTNVFRRNGPGSEQPRSHPRAN